MIRRFAPCLILCAFLAGCGGGSGGSSLPHVPASGPVPKSTAGPQSVTVSIFIPASASASGFRKRPQYISPATQSASIAVNGGTPVIVNLSSSSGNCTNQGNGRTCTTTFDAPVGADTFVESMFASTDGTGPALSQSTTVFTIVAGQANVVNMTLDGIVAAIALTVTPANPPTGSPSTVALAVNFTDASGKTIVGAAPFANPITLSDSDTTGATKLSKTSLLSPQDAANLTIAYNGNAIGPATFSAAAAGVPSGKISPAVLTPQSGTVGFVDWPTYQYDSQRTGYNPYSTAFTTSSISQLKIGWTHSLGNTQSQPIVATNINVGGRSTNLVIVVGYNFIQAFDAVSGATIWRTGLNTQNLQDCGVAGTAGTALYSASQGAVYVAAGNGAGLNEVVLYRLNVSNGSITGQVNVTPTLVPGEAVYSHTAVTLANGLLYLGTGSNCEGTKTGLPSWRGRVVSVDPGSMQLVNTFFATYGQGANYGGGGVWSWGGVSADFNGNIYTGTGNAETNQSISQIPQPPFVQTTNEQAGYAEHLVQLSPDLSTVEGANYPGFNFKIGFDDLDYTGTPVVYQPPVGSGCDVLTATQGKGGSLVINDTQNINSVLNIFQLSVPSANAFYMGNPGYSPKSGLLYAAVSSSGAGGAILPPGLAAIQGCGSSIAWNVQFGPDSQAYTSNENPRSAPTATAGGVVFMGTPCTADGNGGCGAPGGTPNGALWAVDANAPTVLNSGKPVLSTDANIRMAPTVDGLWMYVLDSGGNLYAMTIDPSIKGVAPQILRRSRPQLFSVHKYEH